MKWNDIAGQESAKQYLQRVLEENRVPHALIIAGPPGTGQLPLAMSLAAALQCDSNHTEVPCGQCPACQKSLKMIHPDIHLVFPVANISSSKNTIREFTSDFRDIFVRHPYMALEDWLKHIKADNKQVNISAKECREIIHTLSLKRFEGRKKVMIIWLPEFLGKEGNILLKLIEEPEENTVLILVTENKEAIISTILSRCQMVSTQLLTDDEIIAYLQQEHNCSEDKAREAAWLASGRMNEAIIYLNESEDTDSPQLLLWLRVCYKGQPAEMVSWADGFSKLSKERQVHFLQYGLHFMEQCARAFYLPTDTLRITTAEKEALNGLLPVISVDKAETISKLLNNDVMHLERNANMKICMMATCVQVHRLLRTKVKEQV